MTEAASPAARRAARRRLFIAAAVVLAAAAGGYAWHKWGGARDKGPEYVFATVQRTDFEDLVSATGALQPRDYVDVGAQVSGQLKKLHVEVGTEVTEGQLLAEIDAEQSAARVDASRANLRAQRAQLVQSQVNLQKAERDLARLQRLWKEEATTQELVQNAETTVAATRAQINTQTAQIEQIQASMRVDETNLKYTKIYAPMAGTVVSITAKQGQTLNANQAAPIILRVADLTTMTVQTQVSEADVSKLRLGMHSYFTTLGSQGRRWTGELKKIEPTPTVTNNVVLYNALFDVDNRGRSLLPSMTAQVFFTVAQAKDALVVPMSAITFQRPQARAAGQGASAPASPASGADGEARRAAREQARGEGREGRAEGRPRGPRPGGAEQRTPGQPRPATVKVAVEGGGIVEREVTVGVSNRVQAQILSGLEEGERVVAGTKQAESQQRRASTQQQGPGGMPPGMGVGVPGGRR